MAILTTNQWTHDEADFQRMDLGELAAVTDGRLTLTGPGRAVVVSEPIDAGQAVVWDRLCWDSVTRAGSRVRFRTRFSYLRENLDSARWSALYAQSGGHIIVRGSEPMTALLAAVQFVQYRIEMEAEGDEFPEVSSVRLTARIPQPSGYWPSDLAEMHREDIDLRWLPVRGAASYEIEIAASADFGGAVERFADLPHLPFVPPLDLIPGEGATLWWRVCALDGDGEPGAYSAPRRVVIGSRRLTDEYRYVEHPRLFLNSAILNSLREQVRTDPAAQSVFQELRAFADGAMDTEVPPEEEIAGVPGQHGGFHILWRDILKGGIEALSFSYLMTGEEQYAAKAREIMLQLVRYTSWTGRPFGDTNCFDPVWRGTLETAALCKAVAIAYDWLYDYLSEADRAVIREGLVRLGVEPLVHDWADPDTYWQIPRHQLAAGNWWAVCNGGAGIGALAILGEVPEAQRWVRLVEHAISWYPVYTGFDVMNTELRTTGGREYLACTEPNYGEDGGYEESIGYISYGLVNAMYFVEALKNATGTDISRYFAPNILDEPLYGIFHDLDAGWRTVNFNDSGEGGNLSADLYALVGKHTRNPKIQWLFRATHGAPNSVYSLLSYDPTLPAESPEGLPKIKHFRDIEWVFFRTGWGESDSLFAAKFHQGRGHEDLGQFVIYHKGRRQVVDAGSINYADPIYGTFLNQTKAHNVVMVDGERQWRLDGKVTHFLHMEGIGFAAADLTDAYQDLVNHWRRGVAFLDSGIYIVWDRLSAEEPHTYSWLLHPGMDFQLSEGAVSIGSDESSLNLSLLSNCKMDAAILPGYVLDQERPYAAFSSSGVSDADFLGVFADGGFTTRRQIDQTAVEIASQAGKCLVSLGDLVEESGLCFSGEMLAVESPMYDSVPSRFIAYRCRQLEVPGLSLTAVGEPVSVVGQREGDAWTVQVDRTDALQFAVGDVTSLRIAD